MALPGGRDECERQRRQLVQDVPQNYSGPFAHDSESLSNEHGMVMYDLHRASRLCTREHLLGCYLSWLSMFGKANTFHLNT